MTSRPRNLGDFTWLLRTQYISEDPLPKQAGLNEKRAKELRDAVPTPHTARPSCTERGLGISLSTPSSLGREGKEFIFRFRGMQSWRCSRAALGIVHCGGFSRSRLRSNDTLSLHELRDHKQSPGAQFGYEQLLYGVPT